MFPKWLGVCFPWTGSKESKINGRIDILHEPVFIQSTTLSLPPFPFIINILEPIHTQSSITHVSYPTYFVFVRFSWQQVPDRRIIVMISPIWLSETLTSGFSLYYTVMVKVSIFRTAKNRVATSTVRAMTGEPDLTRLRCGSKIFKITLLALTMAFWPDPTRPDPTRPIVQNKIHVVKVTMFRTPRVHLNFWAYFFSYKWGSLPLSGELIFWLNWYLLHYH